MIQTVGIVLAGGLSTRMGGQDKCLLELGGKTLLQRATDRLAAQVGKVAINANSQEAGYMQTGLPVIADSFEGYAGPLAGVLVGLDWAHSIGADHVVTVAADTPFFPDDLVDVMQNTLANQKGIIVIAETPSTEGKFFNHPTFGLWPTELRNDLREALEKGVRKVMQWVQPHGVAKAAFTADPFDPFFNVNRPEDYLKAQALLKEYSL
jgi:molybdopterin-guanine dinucleotide biosynthesis protein A